MISYLKTHLIFVKIKYVLFCQFYIFENSDGFQIVCDYKLFYKEYAHLHIILGKILEMELLGQYVNIKL